MDFSFLGYVSGARFGLGCKQTDVDTPAIHRNLAEEFASAPRDTKDSKYVCAFCNSLVFAVDSALDIPHVFNPVVATKSVDVIYLEGWPSAIRVEPRQSMGLVGAPINPDIYVPTRPNAPCNGADFYPFANRLLPRKNARGGAVIDDLCKSLKRNRCASCHGFSKLKNVPTDTPCLPRQGGKREALCVPAVHGYAVGSGKHGSSLGARPAKNTPLDIGTEGFAANSGHTLDARAVLLGNARDPPLFDGVDAWRFDGFGERGQAPGLGDRVVECGYGFHGATS